MQDQAQRQQEEMDKHVKDKLAEFMVKGMKISGLEAQLRQVNSELETTKALLESSRKNEEEARNKHKEMEGGMDRLQKINLTLGAL